MKKLLLLILMVPAMAQAHVFYKSECMGIGQMAYDIAQMRDNKWPLEKTQALIVKSARKIMGSEGVWMKDEDDLKGVLQMAETIYGREDLTPEVVGSAVFTSCMASALNGDS